MKTDESKMLRFRIWVLGSIMYALFFLMAGKAVYYQVFLSEWLADKAISQYEKVDVFSGKRGNIYDASNRKMAVSIDVVSVGVHPKKIRDVRATIKALTEILHIDRRELINNLYSTKPFIWIKRQITHKESKMLAELNLPGIVLKPEYSRFYPNKNLGAQVVGFCGLDGRGIEGVEYYYNAELQGTEDRVKVLKDALGRRFESEKTTVSDSNGNNLVLTIDGAIQYITEKALEEAVMGFSGKSGMAIVMNPRTGGILALAHYPSYNPNAFKEYSKSELRNRALTDPFEPGSTMKIFSVAAAIESGICKPTTVFNCENGAYQVGNNVVHDTHSYGMLTVQEIVKYSSNIGAIKVGQTVGAELLYKNLRNFGFGERTGIDCAGETQGTLAPYTKWRKIDAGTIAFGQGVSVSAIQLIAATSAIANGGILMKPHLVQAVTDANGQVIKRIEPTPVRRAISTETARTVRQMMKEVITTGGTGVNAALEGYSVCGKTGTAQKIENGAYARGKYVSSFVGFVPADHPEAVILVIVDEPQKRYYGGTVAAPAFKRIALETLGYFNISPQNIPNRLTVSLEKEGKG
jgi:cell division protein FtsI (penicillin-binding protein 3)